MVFAFCYVGAAGFMFNGMLFVANAAFNNLGRPLWSTAFNWTRDAAVTPLVLILVPAALGAPGGVSTVAYDLEPAGRGTRLTLHHAGLKVAPICEATLKGWETSLPRLAELMRG